MKFKKIIKEPPHLLQLFMTFFKIGCMAIGGGYVILPMILKEIGEKHGWCDEDQIMDDYTLAQSFPGMIAVNTATIIGYRRQKLIGSIVATLGMVLPSFIAIIIIAAFFRRYQNIAWVQSAFKGIRAAVVATITVSVYRMARKSIKEIFTVFMCIISFILLYYIKLSPFIVLIMAAVIGVIITAYQQHEEVKNNDQ